MRKIIVGLAVSLTLVACGQDDEVTITDEDFDVLAEEVAAKEAENELSNDATENYADIMSSDSNYSTFVGEDYFGSEFTFNITDRYKSDTADAEGINDIDIMRRDEVDSEETFDYKFALMLAENQEDGQNYLLFAGEVENNTSRRVQFNHDFDLIMRDIKVESSTYADGGDGEGIVDAYEPEFSGEGWYAFSIDSDEVPEDLEFTWERAWDQDGAGGNGSAEEYLEMEFKLDK